MNKEDEETQHLIFSEVYDVEHRTVDVASDTTFENLMIKPAIIADLLRNGYRKPSPVQAKAIPLGLLGMDLLVQAKTGTGKTLVFGVLCVDHLLSATKRERTPHVLIVAPTREIAHQISEVVRKLCPRSFFHGLFVGGVDVEQDRMLLKKGCQVAVGTAGRLAHLVKHRALDTRKVTLFVLDEADKLMEESFKQEVNYLFSSLPPQATQVCVFSATYPRDLEQTLCNYMVEPTLIRLNVEDVQLVGLKQYAVVEEEKPDVETLLALLNTVTYSQCLIFSNDQKRCMEVSAYLNQHGVRATHFSSALSQEERFKVLKDLKNFRIRVLVSSDLSARGIDAVHVNMVVNLECPYFPESYLHRIGRAGRYGKTGAAFTILSSSKEHFRFKLLVTSGNLNVRTLDMSRQYPGDLPLNSTYFEDVARKFVSKIEPKDNCRVVGDEVKTLLIPVNSLLIPVRSNVKQQTYSREELVALNESVNCEKWAEYACEYLHSNQLDVLIELDRTKYKSDDKETNGNYIQKAVKNAKRRESKQGGLSNNGFNQCTELLGGSGVIKKIKPETDPGSVHYSKSDLIKIRDSLDKTQWLIYLTSKIHWEVQEPPFVVNKNVQDLSHVNTRNDTTKTEEKSRDKSKVLAEMGGQQSSRSNHKKEKAKTPNEIQKKLGELDENNANSYIPYCRYVKRSCEKFLTNNEQKVGNTPCLFQRRDPQNYAEYIERMRKVIEEDDQLLAVLGDGVCTEKELRKIGGEPTRASDVEE